MYVSGCGRDKNYKVDSCLYFILDKFLLLSRNPHKVSFVFVN